MRQFKSTNVKLVITIAQLLPMDAAFKSGLTDYRGTVCIGEEPVKDFFDFKSLIVNDYKTPLPDNIRPDDVAIIPFSSGTSGLPKGVQLSHQNCIANLCQLAHPTFSKYSSDEYDVCGETIFCIPPFFHIYGLNGVLNLGLKEGVHVITLPQFKPEDYMAALVRYRPHILFVVPALLQFLAGHPSVTCDMLASVDEIVVGAAAATPSLQRRMREKCKKDVIILQGYGMTETSPVTLLSPLQSLPDKEAAVGKLFPNTDARIVSLCSDQTVGPYETGEIQFRGPQVMLGYLDNAQADADIFTSDCWLRTGDVAYFDEDGYFYIVDRTKELIKVKGHQVSPTELETIILELPGVADVAVGSISDRVAGELPRAFVVRRPNAELTCEAVAEHVRGLLAPHKWLAGGVRFVDAIPRNNSGKILRKELLNLDKDLDAEAAAAAAADEKN